jgi:hypothetical protein
MERASDVAWLTYPNRRSQHHRALAGNIAAALDAARAEVIAELRCKHSSLKTETLVGKTLIRWSDAADFIERNPPPTPTTGGDDAQNYTDAEMRDWNRNDPAEVR